MSKQNFSSTFHALWWWQQQGIDCCQWSVAAQKILRERFTSPRKADTPKAMLSPSPSSSSSSSYTYGESQKPSALGRELKEKSAPAFGVGGHAEAQKEQETQKEGAGGLPAPWRALVACRDVESLREKMESFDKCPLKELAQHTVFSDGCLNAPVMAVGEAPGADEDRLGKPFVGISGQLLDKMFATIGLSRETNVYISNILPWRPPLNRQPTPEEIVVCLPFIERHISLVRPKVLLCLGGVACKALLRTSQGISSLLARPLAYTNPYLEQPIPTFAFFHPSYLLRSPGNKREAWRCLLHLHAWLEQQKAM